MPTDLPGDERLDIEWSCLTYCGVPMLVLKTEDPLLSAGFFLYKWVEVQLQYARTGNGPYSFDVIVDRNTADPVLSAGAGGVETGLMKTFEQGGEWLMCVQLVKKGEEVGILTWLKGSEVVKTKPLTQWLVEMVPDSRPWYVVP